VPLLVIDRGDEIRSKVDDFLEVLRGHIEEVAETAGNTLEEPDMGDRRSQLDVAHPLPPHLGPGNFDATALTGDATEPNPLVLAAIALPVPGRAKNALVEKAVLLGLQRAVVDRLWLLYLAVRPGPNLIGAGQRDS
jgi:hypothetical protein